MNASRLAATAVAAIVLCCTLPAVASAADYCVYPNQNCSANNVLKLQDALDLAASTVDADRVLLGAGTYVAPDANGFAYGGWSSSVEIVGAGRGQTILTGQQGGIDTVLWMGGKYESSVRDLTVRIPPQAGSDFRGLLLGGPTTARRIEVVDDPGPNGPRYGALLWDGSALEDSTVTLNSAGSTTGVWLSDTVAGGPLPALRGSVIRAKHGVDVSNGGTIERSRVIAAERGVLAAGGDTAISDSLLTLNGSFGVVLRAETKPGQDTNVSADGLTIFAPHLPDTGGVTVSTGPDNTRNAHLTLTNSIVRGGVPLLTSAGSPGTATISASYSDYDSNASISLGGSINESHVSNVGDAGFDEASGHDYELLPTSPLLDKGDPDAPQGLDLNGNPRIADGNGDGYPRHDLGAFELQPAPAPAPPQGTGPAADTQAPLISGFRNTPSVFAVARASTPRAARVARGTRLRYTLSESARVTLKIQRRLAGRPARYRTVGTLTRNGLLGLNRIRFTGRIGRRALRPGRYRAVITATDAAGNRSAPKAASFRVAR